MSNRFQELQELLPLRRLTSLDLSENKIPQAQTDWSHLLLLTVDLLPFLAFRGDWLLIMAVDHRLF